MEGKKELYKIPLGFHGKRGQKADFPYEQWNRILELFPKEPTRDFSSFLLFNVEKLRSDSNENEVWKSAWQGGYLAEKILSIVQ